MFAELLDVDRFQLALKSEEGQNIYMNPFPEFYHVNVGIFDADKYK